MNAQHWLPTNISDYFGSLQQKLPKPLLLLHPSPLRNCAVCNEDAAVFPLSYFSRDTHALKGRSHALNNEHHDEQASSFGGHVPMLSIPYVLVVGKQLQGTGLSHWHKLKAIRWISVAVGWCQRLRCQIALYSSLIERISFNAHH